MNEKQMLLIRTIEHDLTAIDQLYAAIPQAQPVDDPALMANEDALIALAYRLHNLYNAFENIFQNIAAHCENSLDDTGRWHAQLLERMRLDALPLRPAVIDDDAFDALDELRRFRHLFRHAYSMRLDPYRLDLVHRQTCFDDLARSRVPMHSGSALEFASHQSKIGGTLVVRKANALRALYRAQIERFIEFLHNTVESSADQSESD